MTKILVTGGGGYIGSHTIVDLVNNGFEVICADNFTRSSPQILENVAQILQKKITNYPIDLCDLAATQTIFTAHPDIQGIIHFAAYKSVPESTAHPLRYYQNNLVSLLNVLHCIEQFNIPNFVFSSSCSVYGNTTELPVQETTPLQIAESPYGNTKKISENIIRDFAKVHPSQHILLRYFNPVGAHPSALIGEMPIGKPENLVPYITQTAIGKREQLTIFGSDYETRDGTCIRDYIHVMDIANAHTKALQYLLEKRNSLNCDVFNLGTGNGITVLEMVRAFEKVSNQKLNYKMGERRAGDVVQVYANNEKAKQHLNWETQYSLEDMMATAWKWECRLKDAPPST